MTKAIDLGALFADTELPFGHPGRNFDESPAGYSDFDDRYEPPPIDPPEEEIIHYGPGNRPLCGDESPFAIYTDELDQVAGCEDCLGSSPRTCRIRIPSTGATAFTAAGRSPGKGHERRTRCEPARMADED